jgi:drug/metabolite transporter (DMT)-like permease
VLSDNPLRAIALALSATLLFGSWDTMSKYLSGHLLIVEFIWIRYVLFLLMALFLAWRQGLNSFRPCNPKL